MTTNALGLKGQVLVGRYRLVRSLSSGSMGTVWHADDLTLGSPVAIKMLGPLYAKDEAVRARFYQEAQAAAALRSPNVVHTLDYGVDNDDVPFIAMELLEGEDLAHRLERAGALPPAETARIFADVARAVRKAHEAGIIHRDLKPDNIFLARDDEREVAKVLDFGVAKTSLFGAEGMGTQAGVLIGTLPYMSPEQAKGESVDFRADLWALGIIAFECVCGRTVMTAETPGAMILEICTSPLPVPSEVASVPVPPGFDDWFRQACNRDPNARFPSATAMAEALRAVLLPGGEAQEAGRASLESLPGMPGALNAPAVDGAPGAAAPDDALGPPSAAAAVALRSPVVSDEEILAWKPRRTAARTAAVIGLAAVGLVAGLFLGSRPLRSDPTPRDPPAHAALPSAIEAAPPAPADAPSAEAALAKAAPEIAPSMDVVPAPTSAPADAGGSARPLRPPSTAAAGAPHARTATAPARPSKAEPSAQRTRASSTATPSAAGAKRPATDPRIGF
ncbi:protein kinase [Sorangium cellulosum]|uniref:Protein kinase n=1 Tax=Sorangium cellulosum TaxID=56 RepID=A0A2L0EMI8_SORCE|nr:serine/threonine-protein kinase [Sorangium cellulosum]AUX40518.1 protein kinase [Sorangium cellulosum]